MDMLCCRHDTRDDDNIDRNIHAGKILECDYDTTCTKLYKMIEGKKWDEILYFLESSKWYFDTTVFTSMFFGSGPDPRFVESRTWVTALDEMGSVRWCQLPLHAAITFHAPFEVIKKLVEIYPESIRCADDQDMLPLHYAFRFGSEDKVLAYILEEFPAATKKRALRERLPLDMAHYSTKPERGLIIDCYVETALADARAEWEAEREDARSNTEEKPQMVLEDRDFPQRGGNDDRDDSSLESTEDVHLNAKKTTTRNFENLLRRQKKPTISQIC